MPQKVSLYFCSIRFYKLFRGRHSCRCFCVELVKRLPVHRRYSVDIFSYSGPSGTLDSEGKQNTALAGVKGRENCCMFVYFS